MKKVVGILSTLIAVVAVLSAPAAKAGWLFGPSDRDECVAEYAPKAKTKRLTQIAYAKCNVMFNQTLHSKVRASAECVLDKLEDMQTEYAFAAVSAKCDRDSGVRSCHHPEYVDEKLNRCYVPEYYSKPAKAKRKNIFED